MRPLTRVGDHALETTERFDFVVTGDSRPTLPGAGFPRVTHRLFAELRLLRPAFVLYTGDFMWGYHAGRQELLNDFDRFRALADGVGVPLYNVPGNHEMQTDVEAIRLLREKGHDMYGSFDVGRYHFVGLNTDEFWREGRVSGPQLDWLREDLAGHADAAAIFVFMHRPLFSWFQGNFNPDDGEILRGLFRDHPVRAVFAAHDHFFHEEEADGVRYMTVAGAGSPTYAQPTKGGYSHYVQVSVSPDGVDYNVIEPGRLDVEHTAGNDGLEPVTTARVANLTDRDLLVRNLELRVPRMRADEEYALAVDFTDWARRRHLVVARLRDVRDVGDGSAVLSVEVPVPTGTALRVTAEADVTRRDGGEPSPRRALVVNGDDFGRSAPISAGIIRAFDEGILTSTSMMVRWPAAEEAARLALARPDLGVGLHLDLGEWAPRDGGWVPTYEIADIGDPEAVEQEARAQLERFRALMGSDPTHIDSHQHVHIHSPVTEIVDRLATEIGGVPVRQRDPRVRYLGEFYGKDLDGSPLHDTITPERLLDLLSRLRPGLTELSCHPGEAGDPLYDEERSMELRALTDARVRAAVRERGIALRSFIDLVR